MERSDQRAGKMSIFSILARFGTAGYSSRLSIFEITTGSSARASSKTFACHIGMAGTLIFTV
jgi:hypothetical protein